MLVLLRTELLKLSTTRAPWILSAGTLAATTVLAVQPVVGAGRNGVPSIGTAGAALGVLDATGRGVLGALLIGVLVVTTEFRHRTVTASLLQVPGRTRVMGAKALTGVVVGSALGALSLAVVLAVGITVGALRVDVVTLDVVLRGAGLLLAHPLYGLLGVAVGSLLSAVQPVAVVLPLAWLLGLEGLVLSLASPTAALWSIGGTTAALENSGTVPRVLPIWLGGSLLLAYCLLLLAAGVLRVHRADIT